MTLGVSCPSVVRVVVSVDARHLCPFKDEVDCGTVSVSWTTSLGETLELHELAALIRVNSSVEISHEQWTANLAQAIESDANVSDLVVSSEWTTAGATVSITSVNPQALADRAEASDGY